MNIYGFVDLAIMTTVAAALILLVKFAFKEKLSARMHMLIWLVLLAQILCFPVKELLPESNLAVQTYLPSYEAQAVRSDTDGALQSGNEAVTPHAGSNAAIDASTQSAQEGQSVQGVAPAAPVALGVVWLSGALALFAVFAVRHILFLRKYAVLPFCKDADILELFDECKTAVGVKRNIRLKVGAACPMLAGMFRPVIYLSKGYDRQELRYVLIHELCHYKNKDLGLNVLSVAVLCLFWVNPIIWICFFVFRRDMERRCDDSVVRITGNRREYASALLKAAAGAPFLLATSSLISGESETGRRIKRMAAWKKPKVWVSALVAVAAVAVAAALLLNGAPTTKTITYPIAGVESHVIFDVPADWVEAKPPENDGNWTFAGGRAGTATIPMSAEVHSAISTAQSARYGMLKDTAQLAEKTNIVNDITGNLPGTVEEVKVIDGYDWSGAVGKYFTATTANDGKRYNWAIGVGWDIFTVWAEEGEASQEALLEIMKTARYLERPENGLLTAAGASDRYVLDAIEGDVDRSAKKLFEAYLAAYEDEGLPLDKVAKGCKLYSIEPVEVSKDSPLAVIYPNACIYKADYELYPKYKNFYSCDTYNGSDFEVTENGGQRYREKYLLFAENVYLDKNDVADTHQFYFVGFLGQEPKQEAEETSVDVSGYRWAEVWYDVEIQSNVLKYLENEYVGDVTKTSKIIQALPLFHLMDTSAGMYTKESYPKGVTLLTEKEPYGLILNYDIVTSDGMIHPILEDALYERSIADVSTLSNAIGNLGTCTIRLHYDDMRGKFVKNMAFDLDPGFGVDLSKMNITETKE